MGLSEFDLITRFFNHQRVRHSGVELGIGDDAAVVSVPSGQSLVMSMDTLVAGVHFPVDTPAEDIAYKALAVNLSDMAAMGAEPNWLLLALTFPEVDEAWLTAFSRRLSQLADEYNLTLIGGDTTRGPLTISVQINGLVPQGQALTRSGAQAGDLIYVTGQLGDAGLGLKLVLDELKVEWPSARRDYFIQRLQRPLPRVNVGLLLRGLATAAIDISDGLLADLRHILETSKVAASINIENIPVADEVRALTGEWWQLPLTAGDDYELCFTVPEEKIALLEQQLNSVNVPCHCIGRIEPGAGMKVLHNGMNVDTNNMKGFLHFD